ncbi:uncharacterized protein LOC8068958 [Sorghum bicolor]|uniref:DUF1618 domain-containing protein n=2 Tax=Sorghum bicolor TaxID=4558 RepID=A0A1B6P9P0_SORBI|nr:uncharacterized protein LOC8068958 [Sorghum bicolor]KXG22386.1 hypothetical protein SORBI_3009G206100 [Sorghum bicolor]|eukprot:XP_021304029.1 uncharacterized protein LOC8068958 [Sorghum bicolor]
MESHMGLPKDRSQFVGQAVKAVESRLGPSASSRSRLLPRRPKAASPEARSFPKWVMFDTEIYVEDPQSFCEDDPETPSARSRDSNGDDVLVSLRLVAPPGASHLRLHYSREEEAKMLNGTALVAAHLDSVLFRVVPPSSPINPFNSWCCYTDYFVCKAGPSGMSIYGPLPPCYKDAQRMAAQGHAQRSHMLDVRDIGLLRRGEDFAVADLKVLMPRDSSSEPKEAELFRYRSNALTPQWEVKRILICQSDDKDHGLRWWTTDKVVSFEGNLCWIDYHRGILFCDVFDDDPQLQYAELPVEPPKGDPTHPEFGRAHPYVTRSLCVIEGGTLMFVNVTRADGEIASKRKLGSGFTITCWSLGTPLSSKSIGWVKEGAMEAGEIWSQYPIFDPHIPCLSPEFPFVSLNEHSIIYALLCEREYAAGRTWVLVIDIKRKKLELVIPYNDVNSSCEDTLVLEDILINWPLLPSMFSMYLNSHASWKTHVLNMAHLAYNASSRHQL